MSKRNATFQGSKEDGLDRDDGPEDTAKKASKSTMSGRKILNPKPRRRAGGGGGSDLSSIGNPFAPKDPNVNSGSPSPAANNIPNPFNNVAFGNSTQSQSFPAPTFGSDNQNAAPQTSSFPPSQTSTGNIFGNMGAPSTFTFGGSSSTNSNPFAKATQESQQSPATPKFNLFQSSPAQQPQTTTLFGQSTQPSSQSQPGASNPFGQPTTPSAMTNTQPSEKTSPNDMDMVSPPSSNKFSNPLGAFGQATTAATNASTPATSNLFGNLDKPAASQSGAEASKTPTMFGSTPNANLKPADNPFASSNNNIFGNLNKSSSTTPNGTPSANLFGNPKPSTGDSASSTMGSNLFGSVSEYNPVETPARVPPNLFFLGTPAVGTTGANGGSTTPAPSNPFASTPKTVGSLFDRGSNPALGQNAPQTAPPKASSRDANPAGSFASSFGQAQTKQSTASGSSLFVPQNAQSSTNKPAAPRKIDFGAAVGSSSMASTAALGGQANVEAQVYNRVNANIRNALMSLDPCSDWSTYLSTFADAYKSTVQRAKAELNQSQAASAAPSFGTKRKEQADVPEEAPRAPKLLNIASTPSSQTPNKEQSSTAQKFQSILEGATSSAQGMNGSSNLFDKSSAPPPNNLFGQAPASTNLFGGSTAKPNLFGAPNNNKTSSNNLFGHINNASQIRQDEENESEEGDTLENAMRKNSPAPTSGSTKSLFDRIPNGPPRIADEEEEAQANGADKHDGSTPQTNTSEGGDHTWKPEKPISFGDSVTSTSSTPKANGNLFGQSKPAPNLFNFSSTPAGSPFKATESSNLFGSNLKPPTTNQSSRATTPGTEVNGVSASEAEGESSADKEITNGEVSADRTSLSADELSKEDVLFEVPKLKVMQFLPEGDNGANVWTARGTGPFRVMKNKSTGNVRMLLRIAPSGNVIINSPLPKNAGYKKLSQKGTLSIGASGLLPHSKGGDKDKGMHFQQWTARMASDDTAKELLKVLEENKDIE